MNRLPGTRQRKGIRPKLWFSRLPCVTGQILFLLLGLITIPTSADDQAGEPEQLAQAETPVGVTFRFSFSGAPWREVLNWLAEESGLALHVGDLPTGSFTYSDPDEFTIDQAISRVNLFLIPQGYTVVKRGSLLSVISLADPRSLQQLDSLATPTSIQDLASRSEHEIVKCMVPLGEVVAADAIAELSPLMLMIAPVILPKSNQMMVTETAGKVKSVLAVVRALEVPKVESVVRRFDLRHVDVSTVLMIAGTHIGIPMGQTDGVEVSVSTDVSSNRLYVTGTPDKVARLEAFIKILDVVDELAETPADMNLRSYPVTGDNLQAVYDVLQTILEGQSLRLSMQTSTKSIVAYASGEVHSLIEATIKELQAPAIDFAVIELNSLDPYFVVTLIDEMFAAPVLPRDSKETPPPAPKVDADPGKRRLFIRGTADQIAQIKQMVATLDPRRTSGNNVRVLPLSGHQKQQLLEIAERGWRGDNRVFILPSREATHSYLSPIERVIHSDVSQDHPVAVPTPRSTGNEERFEAGSIHRGSNSHANFPDNERALVSLTSEIVDQECAAAVVTADKSLPAPIHGQLVPQGILLQSDDVDALDSFQDHLLEIASSTGKTASPPVIYYLKYVNAEDAVKMLADLLDGGRALADVPANTLINGRSSIGGSGFFGSLTLKKEGMTTVTAGTATIVSDARLNRVIVLGTTEDVAIIDQYMKIVDKGDSITSIETYGKSHVIELTFTKAADVAEMIKQAFASRIASPAQANAQQGNGAGDRTTTDSRVSSNSADRRDGDSGQREVAEKPTRGKLPEMSVAAHAASNSLVITAPDALFAEVEQLVRSIDTMSEQVVEVIPAKDGVDLETILRTLNGESVTTRQNTSRDSRSNSSSNSRNAASSNRSR